MGVSTFDSNKQLRSILTKYNIPIDNSNEFSWKCLTGKNISRNELDTLVRSIGLYCEDVIVNPKDYNWRQSKIYVCEHCKDFQLYFQSVSTNHKGDNYRINLEKTQSTFDFLQ